MKTKNERSSLDALESSGRLSQLSRAKKAVALNSVRHVRMCTAYEKDKHVTVYVLDVFLQAEPRGLPTTTEAAVNTHKQSKLECRLGEMSENTEVRAEYQVEHRYSAFRTLRKRISEAVAVSNDSTHPQWCPYCSRARNIVDSHRFPSRFPNRGRVAVITGLHKLLVHSREHRLGGICEPAATSRQGCVVSVRV
ncbi:unnamed protein product [Peronospora belbahrii]|uniref:PX domain-containing protein n=1 Tax=Peronospora belbahrii TaxID=622444 RepID=A0AAU9LAL2_9STRA|nr:unnamed protein product [Peronospora belbahrii]